MARSPDVGRRPCSERGAPSQCRHRWDESPAGALSLWGFREADGSAAPAHRAHPLSPRPQGLRRAGQVAPMMLRSHSSWLGHSGTDLPRSRGADDQCLPRPALALPLCKGRRRSSWGEKRVTLRKKGRAGRSPRSRQGTAIGRSVLMLPRRRIRPGPRVHGRSGP